LGSEESVRILAVIIGAAFLVVACDLAEWRYRGDGSLNDRGWWQSHDRYILDLGVLALKPGIQKFSLAGLPSDEFTLGFEFRNLSADQAEMLFSDRGGYARLTLSRKSGSVVFSESGPLSEWVWTCSVGCRNAFAYRRGEEREIPISNGVVQKERIAGVIDESWGTYFSPHRGQEYVLVVELSAVDSLPAGVSTSLLGTAGGWK
jgi:hypothetical protein